MSFADEFLEASVYISASLDSAEIERIASLLQGTNGRLFFIGSGGGAGHASHAAADFRKLCGFDAYSPSDNVSELTARVNDEGWDTSYRKSLEASKLGIHDTVFVFSVGGGSRVPAVSMNLVLALEYAHEVGATILGIVGRDGGVTAKLADACLIIPTQGPFETAHVEGMQAVIWHLLVSHPLLAVRKTKWEEVG